MYFKFDEVPESAVFTENCIATIVMQNDDYVSGAIVLAESIRRHETKSDTVCLVTNDISPHGIRLLTRFFTHVVEIPYVEYPCVPVRWKRFAHMYDSWISRSFTKIQIHLLTFYTKVFFIDADMFALDSLDVIFKLTTPAGCLSDASGAGYVHGSPITQKMIRHSVHRLYGVSAGCWLLRPSVRERDEMLKILHSAPVFGNPDFNAGPDEVLTTLYYARNGTVPLNARSFLSLPPPRPVLTRWLNIGREFNCLAWHRARVDEGTHKPIMVPHTCNPPAGVDPDVEPPRNELGDLPLWYRLRVVKNAAVPRRVRIIHFATEKPWDALKNGKGRIWPDFKQWFELLIEMRALIDAEGDAELIEAAAKLLPKSPKPEEFVSEEEAERIYWEEKKKRNSRRPGNRRQPQNKRPPHE
eukprot:gnl/Chilomastix_cuspidata/1266.p1 GENE.gnl/Chilomastix_cuspidata/1266~~gnl/Chilomastix_cuspidata/1266.p1  ORF type:complete len:412 (-),score=117.50 gnl/Chilomastix_cuspidata/1266:145-1380(-)